MDEKKRTARKTAEHLADYAADDESGFAIAWAILALADALRDHAEVMREMLDDTNAEIRSLAEAVLQSD